VLVVPVVIAAVLGGRWAAYMVGGAAILAFALVSTFVVERIETLGEVERQRSALLRSVSHDLRTPLPVIRGGSTELLEGEEPSGPRHRMLELIVRESERLDHLVSNLLSMSRIEAGALRPQRQAVDLAEVVAFCTQRLGRVFVDVHVVIDVPSDLPILHVDHTQLDQVLTNLLENAVRHSPPAARCRSPHATGATPSLSPFRTKVRA
jgi:two-component system sensor histidine kinase KdpD